MMVGYTGGRFENPIYEDVCTDETGHAEAPQLGVTMVGNENVLASF